VASVTPYATTTRYFSDHRRTSSPGTASEPTRNVNPSGNSQVGGITLKSDGGMTRWVSRWRTAYAARASPFLRHSSGTTTRQAPVRSDMDSSQNATSKLNDANCEI